MENLIIDRFEGNYAVCEREDKTAVKIPIIHLPLNCGEGDCIVLDEEGLYRKDTEATNNRKEKINDKMNRLFG